MMRYSVQSNNITCVKGSSFLSFAKNMENVGKNIC